MNKPETTANVKRHAYIIMLHLRSQGWTNFTEIRKLFGWEKMKMGLAISSVAHINNGIDYLREEWGEDIPKMNVFVFTGVTECTPYTCENVFGNADGSQPRPKEIAEYAVKIAAYPKWDWVVEFFRREAFDAADST